MGAANPLVSQTTVFETTSSPLRHAGCERVFADEISGTKSSRPGLDEALRFARADDTFVVWRLDRLGRSLKDLVQRAVIFLAGMPRCKYPRLSEYRWILDWLNIPLLPIPPSPVVELGCLEETRLSISCAVVS